MDPAIQNLCRVRKSLQKTASGEKASHASRAHARREGIEFNSALAIRICPCDPAASLHPDSRRQKIEAQVHLLPGLHGSDSLNGDTGFGEITHNTAVALVELYVGQRAQSISRVLTATRPKIGLEVNRIRTKRH